MAYFTLALQVLKVPDSLSNQKIKKMDGLNAMQDPVLKQAINAWEETSIDPKVREAYFDRRKAILDEKAVARRMERLMAEVERKAKEAKEALEKGERNAREAEAKGKVEGKAEGEAEGQRNLLINLLKSGMKPEEIARMAKVPLEQVREIADTVK